MTTDQAQQTERAGLWVRVSSGGQDEANQVPDVERHAASHGYQVAERYTVHARSASKGQQQPYLDQVLADMRAGEISVLVVWHSDRLERRPGKALLDLLAEVSAAGGRVESVQEPQLGQLDFGSQVTTFIAGLVNAEKSIHLADQVRAAHDRSRTNGAVTGRAPWGFGTRGEKYNRRMVPTDEATRLVPEIYRRCIAGESYATIARWLSDETGQPWWPVVVGKLIKNPAYAGRQTDATGRVIHRCPALVNADVWQRAQDSIAARPKRGPVNPQNSAMLKGAIHCPRCQGPCYRIKAGHDNRNLYYRCTGRGPGRKGCGVMVRQDTLDAIVGSFLSQWDAKVYRTEIVPGSDYRAELATIELELRGLAAQGLSEEDEDAERARLRGERKRLAGLPTRPARAVLIDTGTTYGQEWAALPDSGPERSQWLSARGVAITAERATVTGPADAVRDLVTLTRHDGDRHTVSWTAQGLRVSVSWTGETASPDTMTWLRGRLIYAG